MDDATQKLVDEAREQVLGYAGPYSDTIRALADALEAAQRRETTARVEALREAAEWKRAHNLDHEVWGDYLLRLAHERYQAGGDDMVTIWLNARADEIEKGDTE